VRCFVSKWSMSLSWFAASPLSVLGQLQRLEMQVQRLAFHHHCWTKSHLSHMRTTARFAPGGAINHIPFQSDAAISSHAENLLYLQSIRSDCLFRCGKPWREILSSPHANRKRGRNDWIRERGLAERKNISLMRRVDLWEAWVRMHDDDGGSWFPVSLAAMVLFLAMKRYHGHLMACSMRHASLWKNGYSLRRRTHNFHIYEICEEHWMEMPMPSSQRYTVLFVQENASFIR
jgi:hypothetical protein